MAPSRKESSKISWWSRIPTIVKEIGGLVTAVAALLGALAAVGIIGTGEENASTTSRTTPEGGSAALPTVVRFESSDPDYSERGFFTPTGLIISTKHALASDLQVVWASPSGDEEARVEVVEEGSSAASGAVLMRLAAEQPPPSTFGTRNAQSLRVGEEVTAHLGSAQSTPGEVIETGAIVTVPSYGAVSNLVVTTSLGTQGEGGAPLLDQKRRVVGMLFAKSETRTFAFPIEDLRREFPRAFPP